MNTLPTATDDGPMLDVAVIGAGLAGLAAGVRLKSQGASLCVVEAGPRPGGVVGTLERDGFRFEVGPNTVPASAANVRQLAVETGQGELLIGSSEQAKTRYLYFRGRLCPVPMTPQALLTSRLLSLPSKLKILSEPLRRFDASLEVEPTLGNLLRERLGNEVTERLAGAFVRGVYAGSVDELGVRSAFPRLWALLEEHGSLLRGATRAKRLRERAAPLPGPELRAGALLGFRAGFESFVRGLALQLGDSLRLATKVDRLERRDAGWCLRLADGRDVCARHVVIAANGESSEQLLSSAGLDAAADTLAAIPHRGVIQVHLGYDATAAVRIPEGFGFLVPPEETGANAPRCMGAIFASNLFADRAPAGGAALTLFYAHDTVADFDDAALEALAVEDLTRALVTPIERPPAVVEVVRWPAAIPQATPGHAERIASLERDLERDNPGLHLAGSYTRGVSVDDVLASGRRAADSCLAGLAPVPSERPYEQQSS